MSFPLPQARALGGALDAGDRVDVLAVQQGGSEAGYVMTDVEVLDVDGAGGGPLGAPDDFTMTIAVDADAAVRWRRRSRPDGHAGSLDRCTAPRREPSRRHARSRRPDG